MHLPRWWNFCVGFKDSFGFEGIEVGGASLTIATHTHTHTHTHVHTHTHTHMQSHTLTHRAQRGASPNVRCEHDENQQLGRREEGLRTLHVVHELIDVDERDLGRIVPGRGVEGERYRHVPALLSFSALTHAIYRHGPALLSFSALTHALAHPPIRIQQKATPSLPADVPF